MEVNVVKLKDVVELLNGYAFKSSKYVNSGYRVIRITNVQKGILVDDDPKYYEQSNDLNKYELKIGDILISLTGNVGRVGMVEEQILPAYLNQRVGCLRIKSNKIYDRYLFHFLNNDFFENNCIRNSNGIAQLNLSTEWLKEVDINLPSLEEQKRIARILDKTDEIRKKKQIANNKLDEFLKSTFIDTFGDPIKNEKCLPIKTIGECIKLNPAKPLLEDDYQVTFLGMKDISRNGKVCLENEKFFNEVKSGFTSFCDGDVLLAKITPCFENGKSAIVQKLKNGFGFGSTEFHVLRPQKDVLLPEYLYQIIHSSTFIKAGTLKMTGAVGQKRIPKAFILSYKIVLPPIKEQQEFAQIVKKVEAQKQKNELVIKQMDNLFNSLSQKAFKGEL